MRIQTILILLLLALPLTSRAEAAEGESGLFDGLVDSIGSLFPSDDPITTPMLRDKKNETASENNLAKPEMIKVKRLDQGSPQTGDGKTPAKAEEAPPAPYKVYSSPMIADDPPVNITIGGGETPSIPISETATPSEALSSWQRETQEIAPIIIDPAKPPALPEALRKAVDGGAISSAPLSLAPSSAPAKGAEMEGQNAKNVPPIAALPKQFFPILPMGLSSKNAAQLLPVASNVELEVDHSEVTRAIIYIHDMTRNAAEGIATLMTLSGASGQETLILAPQFSLGVDIMRFAKHLPDSGREVARWTIEDGWQNGGLSTLAPGQTGISSFTAMDILLLFLADRERFPALTKVVVVGHGMGGDFVQRYAAIGRAPSVLKKDGLPVNYVAANVSTFLYTTNNRPIEGGARFGAPDAKDCPTFNDYPYGLMALTSYAKGIGANAIRLDYADRPITYLTGDKILVDHYLDRSCAAMMQGQDRTARGRNFARYISHSYGEAASAQSFVIVPNAGYDPVAMLGSNNGMAAIFGD